MKKKGKPMLLHKVRYSALLLFLPMTFGAALMLEQYIENAGWRYLVIMLLVPFILFFTILLLGEFLLPPFRAFLSGLWDLADPALRPITRND